MQHPERYDRDRYEDGCRSAALCYLLMAIKAVPHSEATGDW